MSADRWTPKPPRGTYGDPLTGVQVAIAAGLIDGLTNAEIAEAVGFGKEKGIASHVERMRAKLGARNRVQLAVMLDRQQRGVQP